MPFLSMTAKPFGYLDEGIASNLAISSIFRPRSPLLIRETADASSYSTSEKSAVASEYKCSCNIREDGQILLLLIAPPLR